MYCFENVCHQKITKKIMYKKVGNGSTISNK